MRLSISVIILLQVFLIALPVKAYALSCAVPTFNETTINEAQIIFEGLVKRKIKVKGIGKKDIATWPKAGDLKNLSAYEFKVTKGWKNAQKGQSIKVLRNTYWGDSFTKGDTSYLVVSNEKIKGYYLASLCGPTLPLEYYLDNSPIEELKGKINVLHQYFDKSKSPKTQSGTARLPDSACDNKTISDAKNTLLNFTNNDKAKISSALKLVFGCYQSVAGTEKHLYNSRTGKHFTSIDHRIDALSLILYFNDGEFVSAAESTPNSKRR